MEWINGKKPGLGFRGFVAGEVTTREGARMMDRCAWSAFLALVSCWDQYTALLADC
jgi:hypothetical protein